MVAVLDFEFSDERPGKFHHKVKLMEEETKEVFYDKLNFIYLEIPKFGKGLDELTNDFERWLFAFKNLHRLREMPKELEEGIFKKLFELAEIAKMKPKERTFYEDSLKDYWDLKSSMETYFKEGREEGKAEGRAQGLAEGKAEGKIEMAIMMLADHEPIEKSCDIPGFQNQKLRNSNELQLSCIKWFRPNNNGCPLVRQGQ